MLKIAQNNKKSQHCSKLIKTTQNYSKLLKRAKNDQNSSNQLKIAQIN